MNCIGENGEPLHAEVFDWTRAKMRKMLKNRIAYLMHTELPNHTYEWEPLFYVPASTRIAPAALHGKKVAKKSKEVEEEEGEKVEKKVQEVAASSEEESESEKESEKEKEGGSEEGSGDEEEEGSEEKEEGENEEGSGEEKGSESEDSESSSNNSVEVGEESEEEKKVKRKEKGVSSKKMEKKKKEKEEEEEESSGEPLKDNRKNKKKSKMKNKEKKRKSEDTDEHPEKEQKKRKKDDEDDKESGRKSTPTKLPQTPERRTLRSDTRASPGVQTRSSAASGGTKRSSIEGQAQPPQQMEFQHFETEETDRFWEDPTFNISLMEIEVQHWSSIFFLSISIFYFPRVLLLSLFFQN